MPEPPKVGIILLNWNGWRDTIECLESLFRIDYPNVHVVVCEQASTDDSLERIRDWASGKHVVDRPSDGSPHAALTWPPVPKPIPIVEYTRAEVEAGAPLSASLVLIHVGENRGSGGGNNVGLRFLLAQQDVRYVWILNNDIVVSPSALTELVRCAESDSRIGAVGGMLMDYRVPTEVQAAGGGYLDPWRGFPTASYSVPPMANGCGITDLDWITGGNILSPVAAIRDVGLIDESYFVYMEDIDHSLRMRAAGWEFGLAARSLVWHKGGATMGHRSPRYDYYMVRNALMVTRAHRRRMTPLVLAYAAYRCVLPKIVRGQWRRLGATVRALRDFRNGVTGPVSFT